jgi:hypothetical protein
MEEKGLVRKLARPSKNGVDYFSHDTASGKTMFTLESKFGNDGYAFWFKLLETLGSQDTLSLDCNNLPDWEYLIAKTRVSEVTATEILDTLSRINAIDAELWSQKVIWVQKFAERLTPVFKKRKTETPVKPNFCHGNTEQNVITAEKSTQRKGKESKVKKNIYGSFKNVNLTDEEHLKLIADYGDPKANGMIEYLSSYREEKGYKNKSDYLSLRRWVADAVEKDKQKTDKPESLYQEI